MLSREYEEWCGELEKLIISAKALDRTELSAQMAHTLEDKETLLRILNMNLFESVFPFTKHTEKQMEAMELAGVKLNEPSIYDMVDRCLLKLIPEKE